MRDAQCASVRNVETCRKQGKWQVSMTCKPARGLRQLKSSDAPEAMKEDGRNEDYRGNIPWRNPMQPDLSTTTVRQEDCCEDNPGNAAWRNPMPFTKSPPKEDKGQSSSSSSWRLRVHEGRCCKQSAYSSERTTVRTTPAPKPHGDLLIDFQPPRDDGKEMNDHTIRNMCSKIGMI